MQTAHLESCKFSCEIMSQRTTSELGKFNKFCVKDVDYFLVTVGIKSRQCFFTNVLKNIPGLQMPISKFKDPILIHYISIYNKL